MKNGVWMQIELDSRANMRWKDKIEPVWECRMIELCTIECLRFSESLVLRAKGPLPVTPRALQSSASYPTVTPFSALNSYNVFVRNSREWCVFIWTYVSSIYKSPMRLIPLANPCILLILVQVQLLLDSCHVFQAVPSMTFSEGTQMTSNKGWHSLDLGSQIPILQTTRSSRFRTKRSSSVPSPNNGSPNDPSKVSKSKVEINPGIRHSECHTLGYLLLRVWHSEKLIFRIYFKGIYWIYYDH